MRLKVQAAPIEAQIARMAEVMNLTEAEVAKRLLAALNDPIVEPLETSGP